MDDDTQIHTLDVLHSMQQSDRAFYSTLRFMQTGREQLLAAHQRNTAITMSLIRLHLLRPNSTRTVQYTATIPLNFPVGWDDPVVVRPSAAQISSATEIVDTADAAAENCAICQESLSPSHTRIIFCGHRFHTPCIGEWFTQSVNCPMCRHDVRTAGSPAPTTSAPTRAPPRVSNPLAEWLVGAGLMNHTVETAESDEHHA